MAGPARVTSDVERMTRTERTAARIATWLVVLVHAAGVFLWILMIASTFGCRSPARATLAPFARPPGEIIRERAEALLGPAYRRPSDPRDVRPYECMLRDVPDPPSLQIFVEPSSISRGIERYYGTVRQLEDVVLWYQQIADWANDVNICLRVLSRDGGDE
jgi:hypothetical protein